MPTFDDRDQQALDMRIAHRGSADHPRVGDWVRDMNGAMRRVSHAWSDGYQTSDGGSYYIDRAGWCEFSGGLYPIEGRQWFDRADDDKPGRVWFFHHEYRTAHNGVDAMISFPVWQLRKVFER